MLTAIGFTTFHLSAINLLLAWEESLAGGEMSAWGAAEPTQLKREFPPAPGVSLGPGYLHGKKEPLFHDTREVLILFCIRECADE